MKAYSRAFLFLPLICDSLLLFLPSIHWPWFSYSLLLPPQPSCSPISTARSPCNRRAWWQGGSPWVRPASQTHRWARSAVTTAPARPCSRHGHKAAPKALSRPPHGALRPPLLMAPLLQGLLRDKGLPWPENIQTEPLGGTRIDRLQRHVEATG